VLFFWTEDRESSSFVLNCLQINSNSRLQQFNSQRCSTPPFHSIISFAPFHSIQETIVCSLLEQGTGYQSRGTCSPARIMTADESCLRNHLRVCPKEPCRTVAEPSGSHIARQASVKIASTNAMHENTSGTSQQRWQSFQPFHAEKLYFQARGRRGFLTL